MATGTPAKRLVVHETTDRPDAKIVIASEAKQSISPHKGRMDCFVALLLAMTVWPNQNDTTTSASPPKRKGRWALRHRPLLQLPAQVRFRCDSITEILLKSG
jgi:hypothetical protein